MHGIFHFNAWAFLTLTILVASLGGVSSATAAAAPSKIVLVVPHRVLFTVAVPVYIAREKGFYKENNLDVDAVFTRGGGENVQAVVSGDAQIGLSTGIFAVLSAFVKKAPIKIAAAEITGMDSFWYVPASSPVRKLEDLAGKKIAYSRPGSSTHMAALALANQIKAKGLKPAEPVSIGGVPEAYTAVRTGQVDAGWSVPPFMLDRLDKGELRVAARGDEITALKEITTRVHFINSDFAAKQPDAVRGFFKAHQKAVEYMMDHREETTKLWIKRAELKIPEAAILKTWDFYNKPAMAAKPIRGIQATMEDAIKFNFLKQPLTEAELNRLIDLRYLE
jgi:NitT/TauT family transport system substrate-binding protein